jgi:hypothetical protein
MPFTKKLNVEFRKCGITQGGKEYKLLSPTLRRKTEEIQQSNVYNGLTTDIENEWEAGVTTTLNQLEYVIGVTGTQISFKRSTNQAL